MRRSVVLRAEPTVRQTEGIIARVEQELVSRGASVTRDGPGRLRFRLPPPWRGTRARTLVAITSGAVFVAAGAGEHRRVRYDIGFTALSVLVVVLSVVLIVAGFAWPRTSLLNALLALWAAAFGIPCVVASIRFHSIIRRAAREVVERRRSTRDAASTGAAGADARGAASDARGAAPDVRGNESGEPPVA